MRAGRVSASPSRPAQFTVLLGLNGAGKSTLFSLITRLYASRSGAMRDLRPRRRSRAAARRCAGSASCSRRARSISISRSSRTSPITRPCTAWRARSARARRDVLARVGLADRGERQGARSVRRPDAAGRDRARAAAPPAHAGARRADGRGSTSRRARTFSSHGARPRRRRGIGVLWATHLLDEVATTTMWSCCIKGRVLADEVVAL